MIPLVTPLQDLFQRLPLIKKQQEIDSRTLVLLEKQKEIEYEQAKKKEIIEMIEQKEKELERLIRHINVNTTGNRVDFDFMEWRLLTEYVNTEGNQIRKMITDDTDVEILQLEKNAFGKPTVYAERKHYADIPARVDANVEQFQDWEIIPISSEEFLLAYITVFQRFYQCQLIITQPAKKK